MKNIKIYLKATRLLSVIVFITMFTSCQDFLDLKPISSSTVATFYESQDDFNQAVVGTYAEMADVYTFAYYMLFADLRADNTSMMVPGGGSDMAKRVIDNFNLDPTNEELLKMWKESYEVIQRANAVLTYIEDVDFEQSVKGQYIGESLALRSLAYFNLVRIFGDVPLVISADADISESYNTTRSPVAEVYSLIVTDLTNAITKLPETYEASESGRVTQGAAQTLLGQVYLTQKNFSEAASQFTAVVGNGNYNLLGAYEENFVGVNQGNGEAVWQILFKSGAGSMGSAYPNWHAPDGSDGILVPTGGTLGFNQVTNDMYDAYEVGDLRRDVSVGLGYTDNNGVWQDAKYIKLYVDIDPGAGTYDSESDWNLFRYSHVLLMAAEALNEESGPTAKCYEYINAVRSRAGLADLSGLDKSSFRNAVYAEQRVEVAFEGHRWFDLIRTDRAISVMNSKIDAGDTGTSVGPGSPISDFQLLFPLPEAVIATSAEGVITQNPGY